MSQKITIGQIVYNNRVRDERLIEIINTLYADPKYGNINKINIFIDLYSIFSRIYGSDYSIEKYNEISQNIINLCASYKRFFARKYKTHAIFYLIDSNNCPEMNSKFIMGYNSGYRGSIINNKRATDIIYHNREILSTICPFIPDVMYVGSNYETGLTIYDIIKKNAEQDDCSPSIVITKDIYNYQLVNIPVVYDNITDKNITTGFYPDIKIIRPKKWQGQDLSYAVDRTNTIATYLLDRKCDMKILDLAYKINSGLLSYIMTVSRMPERNIKSLIALPKIINLIYSLIEQNIIVNGRNTDIERLTNLLFEDEPSQITFNMVDFRFKAIDIFTQYNIFKNTVDYHNYTGMINYYDPQTLMEINMKYFEENPLDLNEF